MQPYIKEKELEKVEHTNSIVIPEEMLVDNSKIEEKNKKEKKKEEKIPLVEPKEEFIDIKEPEIEEEQKEEKSCTRLITLAIIPLLLAAIIVGIKSSNLIKLPVLIILLIILVILIIITIKSKKSTLNKIGKILYRLFMSLYITSELVVLFLLYGPYPNFKNWLITTAMTTMNHQYLATWFYSNKEVEKVLSQNIVIESKEDSNLNLITVGKVDFTTSFYENEYEKQILTKDEDNELYKVIEISGKGYNGFLVAIYDPSRIKVAATKYLNVRGQYVTDMAKDNDAILAINGGGFVDPNYSSNGGTPQGTVIKDGKILSDRPYYKAGGIIGITNENKLILGHMSSSEALKKGVRDAVSFGPFLIVNGVKSFVSGNGGWGTAPRTAIGQRKDGIMLFLVLNGRTLKNPGADMNDLTEIMSNYGAYNASNLDGGTSSVLVFKQEIAEKYLSDSELKTHCNNSYCYINDPIDGGGNHETRWIATSIFVK